MKLMQVTDPETVLELIGEHFQPLPSETASLELAGGRILARPLYADAPIPGFDRSTVDGYALFARESFGAGESLPALFDYAGEIPMGQPAPGLEKGRCFLIHTGGALPDGADAVVMLEYTAALGNQIQVFRQVAPGENVIHKGEDLHKGEEALPAGRALHARELGLLASLGADRVQVYRRPVMGLLSSGDELMPHATALLPPGRIRDSNTPALAYMGRQYGAEVQPGAILADSFPLFLEKSREFLERSDFLVISGGSSVGSRDFTTRTMQELGSPGLLVEGVSLKPGKPTLLASCGGKPVLGLPGHPISAQLVFSIFGAAIIKRLSGERTRSFSPSVRAVLSRNLSSPAGQTEYVRVKLELASGELRASPVFGRSGMLSTLTAADGYLIIPAGSEGLLEGEIVKVYPWE